MICRVARYASCGEKMSSEILIYCAFWQTVHDSRRRRRYINVPATMTWALLAPCAAGTTKKMLSWPLITHSQKIPLTPPTWNAIVSCNPFSSLLPSLPSGAEREKEKGKVIILVGCSPFDLLRFFPRAAEGRRERQRQTQVRGHSSTEEIYWRAPAGQYGGSHRK
jgi:hypothetical protein